MKKRVGQDVSIPHPAGGHLEGRLSYTEEPGEGAVLYVHGFGSKRSGEKAVALERAVARRGWTFAAFNFRGHGRSSGTLLELHGNGLLDDLDVIRAWLAERGVSRLGLVGSSMGGWASAWYSVRRPEAVVGLVLVAPAFNFLRSRWDALTEAERDAWRRTGRLRVRNQWLDCEIGIGLADERDQFPAGRLGSELGKPTLIFHGMRDDAVPYPLSLAFTQIASHPDIELRLIKAGDHRLTAYKDEIAEAACGFFGRLLTG
jgi:pimeloyl-ACP methyl ester carboxylesterase